MNDYLAQYSASIERMNEIGRQGNLNSVHISILYRRELKNAMRALRQVIAQERNAETRRLYQELLGTLKHLHYSLIGAENCSIALTIGQN
jgi:hypothetical protein